MATDFFKAPILNSPYEYPGRHWVLDEAGQPTHEIANHRRRAKFVTPIPKPKKRKAASRQAELALESEEDKRLATEGQKYNPAPLIDELRRAVDEWRELPQSRWKVTPETARLLQHWRHYPFENIRPFFCQIEAAETAIWLTEVAPKDGKRGQRFLDHLESANAEANPGLSRLALKLATGAGKTTVMAMLIAWQTVNKVRHPASKRFSRAFLVVTPGITIRDRLRVLLPNDPESYYSTRDLVPKDMLGDLGKARIVITNYHAFKLRERMKLSKGNRALLQGRGEPTKTLETEGQMIQRALGDLMAEKNIMVLNDEAHHCYREKPTVRDERALKADERKEAKQNAEAARLWLTGLGIVDRHLGVNRVMDLSATPFFLRGSGYAEGTMFPWAMSDFSLMDAIECGIVKLPRVPVADNLPAGDMPMYRNLWEHIRTKMPKKGRGKGKSLDPLALPLELCNALDALYGHYVKTYELWQERGKAAPPCFIVVCNNTSSSKLVYDYIAGFDRTTDDDEYAAPFTGKLPLFSNYDENGQRLARPRTLLIDSEQLESGDALEPGFRKMAKDEIDRFRREMLQRGGDRIAADNITDQDLLREVMNTVGRVGTLGESIRCVVSVSMLTEGWDANTVTHVLGVRAFGTQLLCEQVIGRALRRESYRLNEDGVFDVEYADVLGIPFDFTAKPVVAAPQPPRETVQVKAVSPERDELEIRFPCVAGYRVELPETQLTAKFTDESTFQLDPGVLGPTKTRVEGIIGEGINLTLEQARTARRASIVYHLTSRILQDGFRDGDGNPEVYLFGQLKTIVERWMDGYLVCKGGTDPRDLMHPSLMQEVSTRVRAAITRGHIGDRPIQAILDPYNPDGSTRHVNFATSRTTRWQTRPDRCHVNWVVCDSEWEAQFCRIVEEHPRVRAYVKNHSMGFEVPYVMGGEARRYRPDFIVLVDDGHGDDDLLHLVVEVKGYRREDAKRKKETMETYWVPGVNRLGEFGRWTFVELADVFAMEAEFEQTLSAHVDEMIETAMQSRGATDGEA